MSPTDIPCTSGGVSVYGTPTLQIILATKSNHQGPPKQTPDSVNIGGGASTSLPLPDDAAPPAPYVTKPYATPNAPSPTTSPAERVSDPKFIDATLAAVASPTEEQSPKPGEVVLYPSSHARCALLATLAAIFAGAILFAIVGARLTSGWKLKNVCSTRACRSYSASLRASLNTSVDPCQSFSRFVCDGWRQQHRLSVREEHFLYLLDRLTLSVRAMTIRNIGQSDEEKATKLYLTCADVLDGTSDQLPAVKDALAEAGIAWPRRAEQPDLLFTLLYSSLKLGWDVLFEFFQAASDRKGSFLVSPGKSLEFLSSRYSREYFNDTRRAYFEALKTAFEKNSTRDEITYEETTLLEDVALIPLLHSSSAWNAEVPADELVDSPDVKLSPARWLGALEKVTGEKTSGYGVPIVLRTMSSEYTSTFIRHWRKLGEPRMYVIASWCVVQVAALYANLELVLNYYDNDATKARVYHGAFCFSRAFVFNRQVLFRSHNSELLRKKGHYGVKQLISSVLLTFHRLSNETSYYPDTDVITDWIAPSTPSGNLASTFEVAGSKFTSLFSDMTDSLIANWRQSQIALAPRGANNIRRALSAIYELASYVLFDKSHEGFQLLPYSLSFPLFDPDLVTAVNYGGIGAEVSRASAEVFLNAHANYTDGSQVMQPLTSCLADDSFLNNGTELPQRAKDILASAAVVEAYRSAATGPEDMRLEGFLQYSGVKLLLIAMCYAKCTGSASERKLDSLCDWGLRYTPQFVEAFNCSPDTPMNAVRKMEVPRQKWASNVEFLLASTGMSIGLGNIWRFPYVAYSNGGGAFLLPYLIIMTVVGRAMFYMEMLMGQFRSAGATQVFDCVPMARGVGWAMVYTCFVIALYYNLLLSYSLNFLWYSFKSVLPWTFCDPEWADENCVDSSTSLASTLLTDESCGHRACKSVNKTLYSLYSGRNGTDVNTSVVLEGKNGSVLVPWDAYNGSFSNCSDFVVSSPEEFYENYVLGVSSGVHELGKVQTGLAVGLAVSWVAVFFCVFKGVRSSGKWEKLKLFKTWRAAAVQIFFSISLAQGLNMMLASYNDFNNNIVRDVYIIAATDSFISIFGGIVIFSVLGNMAFQLQVPVPEVVRSAFGLAFVVYPQALSLITWPNLWSVTFFAMLFLLAIDSEFGFVEAALTPLKDESEACRAHETYVATICCVCFFIAGLPVASQGGLYILTLMDEFVASHLIPWIGVAEMVTLVFGYGISRMIADMEFMLGGPPGTFMYITWKYVLPVCVVDFRKAVRPRDSWGPKRLEDRRRYRLFMVEKGYMTAEDAERLNEEERPMRELEIKLKALEEAKEAGAEGDKAEKDPGAGGESVEPKGDLTAQPREKVV
ncbi:hypothetical protein HPB48_002032 [Haemaphysalis longicornis]|uniref:Transporter n=1 Tax=Haemaphysalis longicornis TaxID=44386 RepID=A0A9J6FN46_HAELO|nr:hypothetical protein HPB48_002032 [Haemaphysalis longicornis]